MRFLRWLFHWMFLVCVLGAGILSGCGSTPPPNLITHVEFRSYLLNGDQYGEVTADLNTGQAVLPSFQFPILNPGHPEHPLGSVGMRTLIGGGSELQIAVNISETVHLPLSDGKLPNGSPIPIAGLGNTPLYGVPLGVDNIRMYFAFATGIALIGTAIPIAEFDRIAQIVGGANLFIPITFPNGIRTVAGVFTGSQPGTSGIAVFVDAGSVISLQAQTPGTARESQLRTELYRLQGNRPHLRLH